VALVESVVSVVFSLASDVAEPDSGAEDCVPPSADVDGASVVLLADDVSGPDVSAAVSGTVSAVWSVVDLAGVLGLVLLLSELHDDTIKTQIAAVADRVRRRRRR
jgi:hypothetical protein